MLKFTTVHIKFKDSNSSSFSFIYDSSITLKILMFMRMDFECNSTFSFRCLQMRQSF